ncbi:MAG: Spy/CpxP family protein refolding chaperone [Verrucomicrobiota bacterium]
MKTKSVLFATLAALAAALFVPVLSAEPSEGGERKGPPPGAGQRIEKLKTELGLTDAQVDQLKPILREQMQAMKALRDDESLARKEKRAKFDELRETHRAKLAAILTPEQAAKLDDLMKDRKGPGGPKGKEGKEGKDGERKGPPPPADDEA